MHRRRLNNYKHSPLASLYETIYPQAPILLLCFRAPTVDASFPKQGNPNIDPEILFVFLFLLNPNPYKSQ